MLVVVVFLFDTLEWIHPVVLFNLNKIEKKVLVKIIVVYDLIYCMGFFLHISKVINTTQDCLSP